MASFFISCGKEAKEDVKEKIEKYLPFTFVDCPYIKGQKMYRTGDLARYRSIRKLEKGKRRIFYSYNDYVKGFSSSRNTF